MSVMDTCRLFFNHFYQLWNIEHLNGLDMYVSWHISKSHPSGNRRVEEEGRENLEIIILKSTQGVVLPYLYVLLRT